MANWNTDDTENVFNKPIHVDEITDAAGTGSPDFPNGMTKAESNISTANADTGNGRGTGSDSSVRRYTNIGSTGSDITVADSASLGTTFTINQKGVYAIDVTEQSSVGGAQEFAITVNWTTRTVPVSSIPASERKARGSAAVGGFANTMSVSIILQAGDIVRIGAGANVGTSDSCRVEITQLQKLS
jgi:hypothetical protein